MNVKFAGDETRVPLLDGTYTRYVNLDNAASTPCFQCVQDSVNNFLPYYSSVHRGNGFKSLVSTHFYDRAHAEVLKLVDADPSEHMCIFGKNTSDASTKLARTFPITPERNVVLVSSIEHHSSDLPFRFCMQSVKIMHINANCDGTLSINHLDELLSEYGSKTALVVITAASNVTGVISDIHTIARKTHAVGAQIYVDCAQIIAHRKVSMKRLSDPEHLDYIAFSAHKMYAPFGTGALIGRIDLFNNTDHPEAPGGGTVELVTYDKVKWTLGFEREENGSPNTIGAVALLASIRQMQQIGFEAIARHEAELMVSAIKKMKSIPGIRIFGVFENIPEDQLNVELAMKLAVGVIPFEIIGMNSNLVSAILSHEHGIGVRTGCFCAHPYLMQLLQVSDSEKQLMMSSIYRNDNTSKMSIARVSFGLGNTEEDVDRLILALNQIALGNFVGRYALDVKTGYCFLQEYNEDFEKVVTIGPARPTSAGNGVSSMDAVVKKLAEVDMTEGMFENATGAMVARRRTQRRTSDSDITSAVLYSTDKQALYLEPQLPPPPLPKPQVLSEGLSISKSLRNSWLNFERKKSSSANGDQKADGVSAQPFHKLPRTDSLENHPDSEKDAKLKKHVAHKLSVNIFSSKK